MKEFEDAIKRNDASLVRALLAQYPVLKSNINEPLPGFSFDTPALIGAVNGGNRDVIDALLESGADINVRSKWWAGGFGVLDICNPELADFLIQRGAYVDIHAASRLGLFPRVRELVEGDAALVSARGGDGQTPLHFAASLEIAAYLLDHGAEIDTRDIDHESTAAQYMLKGRPEIARYLISRGAQTDIFMAAALGDLALVRKHLDADASAVFVSVSEKDLPKQNPASGGSIYIFILGWGTTPHMLARQSGHEAVFQWLMERSPLWLQLAQACQLGDEALAKNLLAAHPDAAKTLPPEAGPQIVGAASRNDARAVQIMLDAGWPADARGQHDQTALHWAAWHGNVAMLRHLLRHHAPLNVFEVNYGGAPIAWALHGSKNGWHATTADYGTTVELLLVAGARAPEVRDDLHASAEAMAALRRHVG